MQENQSENSSQKSRPRVGARTIISALIYLFVPPILLFGGAGRLKWPMGWVYIVLTLGAVILSRVLVARVHPDLLSERRDSMEAKDVPAWDRKLVPFVSTYVPLAIMLVAGLDKRFSWTQPLPVWTVVLGVLIVIAAIALSIWAMVTNRYFSAFVRLQTDRGQQVVSSGPYAFVRHPGYAAGILVNLGAPFMLGTLWALAPAVLGIGVVALRTSLEDRFLQDNLDGYKAYTERIRWRLLPYIW